MDREPPLIQYLNTDLMLWADFDLGPLTEALFKRGIFTLGCAQDEKGIWMAACESNSKRFDREPEQTIRYLLSRIEKLDRESRKAWEACTRREFDIGYDCGDEPWRFNNAVSLKSLQRMVTLGIELRVTIYPFREG